MGAITENAIIIPRGDTARKTIDLTTEEGELYEVGEKDKLVLKVKKNLCDKEPCILKEVIGSNEFHFKPEDTENLPFGSYFYSVRVFTAEGDKYTPIDKELFEVGEVV